MSADYTRLWRTSCARTFLTGDKRILHLRVSSISIQNFIKFFPAFEAWTNNILNFRNHNITKINEIRRQKTKELKLKLKLLLLISYFRRTTRKDIVLTIRHLHTILVNFWQRLAIELLGRLVVYDILVKKINLELPNSISCICLFEYSSNIFHSYYGRMCTALII